MEMAKVQSVKSCQKPTSDGDFTDSTFAIFFYCFHFWHKKYIEIYRNGNGESGVSEVVPKTHI